MINENPNTLLEQLEKYYSLIQTTMESSTDGIVIFSNEGNIIDFNKRYVSMWNIPIYILKNNNTVELIEHMASKISNPDIFKYLSAIPGNETGKVFSDRLKLNNGLVFECHSRPQYFKEQMNARVWSFHDITEFVDMKSQIAYLATHDQLTGLGNRYLMIDRLEFALDIAKRNSLLCAIFFINIDKFKNINEVFGSEAGDKILVEFSLRIKNILRNVDFVARSSSVEYTSSDQINANEMTRIGGDEFLIILHLHDKSECVSLYNRIKDELSKPFIMDNHSLNITFSMGISVFPNNGKNANSLLSYADQAMNLAKRKGGNCYQFYS